MDNQLETLNKQIEALHAKAQGLVEKLESEPGAVEEVQRDLKSVQAEIQPLIAERKQRLHDQELKDMKAQVQSLTEVLDDFRSFNPDAGRKSQESDNPYATGQFSFFQDVQRSRRGDAKAMQRLEDVKAMTEGTDSAGGYLVTPELANELLELRLERTIMRNLVPSLSVNSDKLEFVEQTGGLTAGWVAELAAKPSADMTFGQISVSVFTAAGLAVTSNQLLQDAGKQSRGISVSIDQLIVRELAKRLAILEEIAILNGTGTGQPLGILGTSGVNSVTVTPTDIPTLLDKVIDGIVAVQDNFKADPTGILMHPRTWARIIKAREASSPSTYLIGAGSTAFGRRGDDSAPGLRGRNGMRGLVGELFGYPVYVTANMPTNLGAGTNESRVIVGAFDEALILDRQGVTVDTSEHVYFTSNQTVFRAEMRVGFTAARYPEAFSVISGAGLANG